MESLYILIPVALIFVSVAVGVFFWAVKSGQYDDLESQGKRILFDDDVSLPKKHHSTMPKHTAKVKQER